LAADLQMYRTWLEIREKPGIFQLAYQRHSSSTNYARQLFKQSAMKKNFLVLGFVFFVSDIISKVNFSHFWLLLSDLAQTARWKYFAEVFIEN